VLAANSATNKLIANKRWKVLMIDPPGTPPVSAVFPTATLANAKFSEAQVTDTSASVIMNPKSAKELRTHY
jgi:hypothetical protein